MQQQKKSSISDQLSLDDDQILINSKKPKTQQSELRNINSKNGFRQNSKQLNQIKTGYNSQYLSKDIKKELLVKSNSQQKLDQVVQENLEQNQEENGQGKSIVLSQIFPNYQDPTVNLNKLNDKDQNKKAIASNKTVSDKFLKNRKIIKDIKPSYLKEFNDVKYEEFDIIGNCYKIVQNQQRKSEKNWEKPKDENDKILQKVTEKYSSLQTIQKLLTEQYKSDDEHSNDMIDESNDYLYQYYALQQQKQMQQINNENQIEEKQDEENQIEENQKQDVENMRNSQVKTSNSKLSRTYQQLNTLQSTPAPPIYPTTPNSINQKKNIFNRVTYYRASTAQNQFIIHSQQKLILNNLGNKNPIAPQIKNITNKTVMSCASVSEIKKKFDHLQMQKDAEEQQQLAKQKEKEKKISQKQQKQIGIYGLGANCNFGIQQQYQEKQQQIQQITQIKKEEKKEIQNITLDLQTSQINEQNILQNNQNEDQILNIMKISQKKIIQNKKAN